MPVLLPEELPKGVFSHSLGAATVAAVDPGTPPQPPSAYAAFAQPPINAGVRKEVRVQGKSVLLFWYRNQIYAIEAR